MPDDTQTPNTPLSGTSQYPPASDTLQNPATPLPPGLSPVTEPATIQSESAATSASSPLGEATPDGLVSPKPSEGGPAIPAVPVVTPSPFPLSQTPPPSNLRAGEAGAAGTLDVPPPSVDVSAIASAKADPSALAGLATSLNEIPSTPVIPPADTIPASQGIPVEPEQKKKSGGKTSAIIGGLFLLIVLPVLSFYVAQKTDILSNLLFALGPAWDYKGTQGTTSGGTAKDGLNRGGRGLNLRNTQEPIARVVAKPAAVVVAPPAATTPTSTPTETPTSTPTSTPTPTSPPVPGVCDASCNDDSGCSSGFVCATVQGIKRCRKPECPELFTCVCPAATATPIPTIVPTRVPTRIIVVTATPTPEPTIIVLAPTPKVPVSGVPSVLGASTIVGGILLLLLGLLL